MRPRTGGLAKNNPAGMAELKRAFRIFSEEDFFDHDHLRRMFLQNRLQTVGQSPHPVREGSLIREDDDAMVQMANFVSFDSDDAEPGSLRTRVDSHDDHGLIRPRGLWLGQKKRLNFPRQKAKLRKVKKISLEIIEKYQEILQKDPRSKVFAALADAYREHGMLKESEATARKGIERHPDYVGGYVALARLLCGQKRFQEALPILNKAVTLAPENLLAYQLLGQAYVELKKPREALKAHKMALFLNPLSERSRKAVEKLETLTADEYEEDLFQMKPLPKAVETLHGERIVAAPAAPTPEEAVRKKERQLSWVDALIVRNEIEKAREIASELMRLHPEDPQVRKRWDLLKEEEEQPTDLRPLLSREKAVLDRQIQSLEKILLRLQQIQSTGPETTL